MPLDPTQDVFRQVLARPVTTPTGDHPGLVHLWWSAPEQGERLVQVYLDGVLVDVSQDTSQREMWLTCDRTRAHRIELLAVDATAVDGLWRDYPDRLNCWSPSIQDELSVALIRDQQLPIDSHVCVDVDSKRLDCGEMWPAQEHRGGFGSLFGIGEFGYDAATGVGLGMGELGMGPLGTDGTAWRWRRNDLEAGPHLVEIGVIDLSGQSVADRVSLGQQVIEGLVAPAATFTIGQDFNLQWSV